MSIQGDDGVKSGIIPNHPFGVWGDSGTGGNGVVGTSNQYSAVAGFSTSSSKFAAGVYGNGGAVGVAGTVNGASTAPTANVGVYGTGSNNASLGGIGVQGISDSNVGVSGQSMTGVGVSGESSAIGYNFGVVGKGRNAGVAAFNSNNSNAAYLASDCCAAWFTGGVTVTGPLVKGGGGFKIDHPQDPGKKYLAHSFVESAEMKNVYDGVIVTDANGEAVIELPEWFGSLNEDYRYQLTPLRAPCPNLHVSEEISNNRFKIAGAQPDTRVSWQVTGIRKDAWAKAHPITAEQAKPSEECGYYLHPDLHGASEEQSIGQLRHGEA